jgi:hypothetical protein
MATLVLDNKSAWKFTTFKVKIAKTFVPRMRICIMLMALGARIIGSKVEIEILREAGPANG